MTTHRRIGGAARVWLLAAGMSLLSGLLLVVAILPSHGTSLTPRVPWPLLAAAFLLAEVFVVHLQFRRNAYSFSLNEIPLVLGLFFGAPAFVVLAQVLGAGLSLAFYRKQSRVKLAFNLAQLWLATELAWVTFRLLVGGASPADPRGWIAALAASLVAIAVATAAIGAAITLTEGRVSARVLLRGAVVGGILAVTNTSLALATATLLSRDALAVMLLLVPAAVVFLAYRGYTSMRQKHDTLETLGESARVLQRSLRMDATVPALLERAREMFGAEVAELTLLDDEHGGLRARLGPDTEYRPLEPVELVPTEGVWARIAAEDSPVLLTRPIRNDRLREHYEARGIRDAMFVPVHRDGRVVGKLVVANRLGDVGAFDADDLQLLEALAIQASAALENARLVGRLEEALEHQRELNRLKDDFVAAVSHELRTPLTSIQGFTHTLVMRDSELGTPERQRFLSIIERQGERLRRLIEDLLLVSQVEARTVRVSVVTMPIADLLSRVADDFPSQHERIAVNAPKHLPEVLGDEETTRRIITNLVDNALKYSPSPSPVTVNVRMKDDGVVVSVEDHGSGIPADVREKVFDRFYQVDQSATRTVGGVGLGLYICRQLAEQMGARLWLERSDSSGSVFSLWMPVAAGADVRRLRLA